MQQPILRAAAAVCAALAVPAAAGAAGPSRTEALPCVHTAIAARKAPTGPAQFESGTLKLANGASMRLQGTPAELGRANAMAVGDAVAACYGPLRNWADAGPARTIVVLDLKNGEYFASLIGNWNRP